MMINKRVLTWIFGAALLASGGAEAQFYVRADGAYSKTVRAEFQDVDPTTGFLISGNTTGTAPGQLDDFGRGTAVSVGAGTRFAPSGRTDITVAYRKFKLDQNDKFNPPTKFTADITSVAVMGNLYLELSENGGVTPYIGLGVGAAQNKLGDVSFDDGAGFNGTVVGDTKLGFAWGAMFGFSFPMASHFAFDIAYRYMDLGDVQTKADLTITGVAVPYAGASGHLRVHELAAGFRF